MIYVVSTSEGDTFVKEVTEQELVKNLDEGRYGEPEFVKDVKGRDGDTENWEDKLLIIKGEIITPKPRAKVVNWEIPEK